jgi:hypothetical protein
MAGTKQSTNHGDKSFRFTDNKERVDVFAAFPRNM